MRFIPKYLEYTGPLGPAEFFITTIEMVATEEGEEGDVKVQIFLKRRISKHMQSTYLPSLCILIIAQVGYLGIEKECNFDNHRDS